MSIPERLWRVARGHWVLGQERLNDRLAQAERELDEATRPGGYGAAPGSVEEQVAAKTDAKLAEAAAYREIAEILRSAPPLPTDTVAGRTVTGTPAPPSTAGHDPLEACYTLLRLQPGADLSAVEAARRARMSELQPERYPAGSAERARIEAQQSAVDAAYHKLRDALNPTETRFERLEF